MIEGSGSIPLTNGSGSGRSKKHVDPMDPRNTGIEEVFLCVRYLDALCDVVEHVDCLPGEGEIAPALPLILAQLPVPARLGLLGIANTL
jgi:hypothetical protein